MTTDSGGIAPVVSERIEVLRYPLIVGVVFIHAFPVVVPWAGQTLGTPDPGLISLLIRNLLSEGIFRIPVPMLFFLSGLLFFWGMGLQKFVPGDFIRKLRSRIRTLLVPFLFWNVVILLFLWAAQNSPLHVYFPESYPISSYGFFNIVNAILGLTHAPIAYQFWFIRNLMVLVILSPLVYWVLRVAAKPFLLGMGFIWLWQLWPLRIPDAPGLFFFSVGAFCGLTRVDLRRWDPYWRALLPLYLLILACDVAFKGMPWSGRIHHLGILVGVPLLFVASRWIVRWDGLKRALLALAPTSFFLFATHEPWLMMLRKTAYVLVLPQSDLMILGLYFLHPLLVIFGCTWLYRRLLSHFPGAMAWVTGGR